MNGSENCVSGVTEAITLVPEGAGSVTTAVLMKHVVDEAENIDGWKIK